MRYGTRSETSSTASRQRNVPTTSDMTAISSQRENALATLYLYDRDLPAARRALERALELVPDDARLMRRLSEVASQQGDSAVALLWAERAIAGRPYDPHGYNHLATVHCRVGDFGSAAAAVTQGLEHTPEAF